MAHLNMSLRGASGMNTKVKPPTVTLVAPASGAAAGGTAIVITGTNFRKSAHPHVTIGGVACTAVVVVDSKHIHCTTGAHGAAGPFPAVVTNAQGGDGYGMSGSGSAYTYT